MVNIVVRPLRARFLLLASAFGAVILVLSLLVPPSAYAETPEPPETVAPTSYLNPDGSPAPDPDRPDIPQAVQDAEAIANGMAEPQIQTRSLNAVSSRPVFKPGRIIDDEVFFNHNTMTAAQIQTFLNQRLPKGCTASDNCLRNYKQNTKSIPADRFCGAYQGATNESAATIIYKVAKACKINPQVLLVTMQKEQSLLSLTKPSNWSYNAAMGMACPDTSPCDPAYANFFGQVYGGARQFQVYANDTAYFKWYPVGQRSTIYYNFDKSCGSTSVLIENKATAGLYYYTPYQPNAAALAAGYGAGDRCSAHGNRDFFYLFNEWFGPTTIGGTAPVTPKCSIPSASEIVFLTKAMQTNAQVNARKGPSTDCESYGELVVSTLVTEIGAYGGWSQVETSSGDTRWIRSDFLSAAKQTGPYQVQRIEGADRYQTAVNVSKQAYPNGNDVVFLVSGSSFADALSAAPVASIKGAALLQVATDAIPASTLAELKRLKPTSRIVLVGGEGVISAKVEQALRAKDAIIAGRSLNVVRHSGKDRYETSRELIRAEMSRSGLVYVATGRDFADALTAAAVAGANGAPVLLVDGKSERIDEPTKILLTNQLKTSEVLVLGGPTVVSTGIESSIRSATNASSKRIQGKNRFETSLELNKIRFKMAPESAIIASGLSYPDSISAAVLAGKTGSPLFTQPATCMTPELKSYLASGNKTKKVTLIGGSSVLSDQLGLATACPR